MVTLVGGGQSFANQIRKGNPMVKLKPPPHAIWDMLVPSTLVHRPGSTPNQPPYFFGHLQSRTQGGGFHISPCCPQPPTRVAGTRGRLWAQGGVSKFCLLKPVSKIFPQVSSRLAKSPANDRRNAWTQAVGSRRRCAWKLVSVETSPRRSPAAPSACPRHGAGQGWRLEAAGLCGRNEGGVQTAV